MAKPKVYKTLTKDGSRQTNTKADGMVCISLSKANKDKLEKLDEYAELWEVSRSAAFWRLLSQYESACVWGNIPESWQTRKGKV